jgi:predicted metal-dependent hydrolase
MDPLLERGIRLFNEGAYFECHEVLEEAWTPERGPRRLFLQGLIHVAVGLYHHTRGNPAGAIRQLRKALRKLSPYSPVWEEVDVAALCRDTTALLDIVESAAPLDRYPVIRLVRRQAGRSN